MGFLITKLRIVYCCVRVEIFFKSVNIWQSYKQERGCLMHFARLANTLLKDGESAPDNHVFACNFAKYSPIKQKFTNRLSIKPFLIWILTTPPAELQYVATLPGNLSLMACFADVNVSRASAATYARCGGILSILLQIYKFVPFACVYGICLQCFELPSVL